MKNIFAILLVIYSGLSFGNIHLESGDSVTIGGQTVSCGAGVTSCQALPGKRECTDWQLKGLECRPDGNYSFPIGVNSNIYNRTCRTFDGCGSLTGSFEEENKSGISLCCLNGKNWPCS